MFGFIDARQLPANAVVETGVCIVGAGAAGITLARALAGLRVDVCLLESGGFELDAATQSLYDAENGGLSYFPLDANRQRSFGGTTNLWAGWCRPLDTLDFTPRPWVEDSGWPITERELLPYYPRACDECELDRSEADPDVWEQSLGSSPLRLPGDRVLSKLYRLSPPTRFGQVYREALARADNVRVLLHANAMQLEANDTATLVTGLRVGCLAGNRLSVKARQYVLAAGGIENARLLLCSNAVQRSGLGNQHDVVGRYFMEHFHFPAETLLLPPASAHALAMYCQAIGGRAPRLALTPALQEAEQLLNHSVMPIPVHWYDRLARALERRIARRAHPLRARLPRGFDPGAAARPTLFRAVERGATRRWRLHHTFEQAPNPDSRVTLSAQRDALGMPRVRLEWRTTPLDRQTAERAPYLVGEAFERARLGWLQRTPPPKLTWPPSPLQGLRGHHMGTTRMSSDPHCGVVDAHCRVHGIANLFIAGSSVFPTAGAGAPTLTIVALALRLADHLKLGQ